MNPYEEDRKCPKCGTPAAVRWDPNAECLNRTCLRCAYRWQERPLDQVPRLPPGIRVVPSAAVPGDEVWLADGAGGGVRMKMGSPSGGDTTGLATEQAKGDG